MEIRKALPEELTQVLTVLNNVALDLQEKGIFQWQFPWDSTYIKSEIENDACYVMVLDGRVLATFFINEIDVLSIVPLPARSLYLSKIALFPACQGRNLGAKVIRFAFELAHKEKKSLFLDCWAGNEKLKAFYSRNGFEYLGDFPEDDYLISVFKYN